MKWYQWIAVIFLLCLGAAQSWIIFQYYMHRDDFINIKSETEIIKDSLLMAADKGNFHQQQAQIHKDSAAIFYAEANKQWKALDSALRLSRPDLDRLGDSLGARVRTRIADSLRARTARQLGSAQLSTANRPQLAKNQ